MMGKKLTPTEFRRTGLLWYLNQQLHLFGLALVVQINDDKSEELYVQETDFRGFSVDANDTGYRRVTKYLDSKIKNLKEIADKL